MHKSTKITQYSQTFINQPSVKWSPSNKRSLFKFLEFNSPIYCTFDLHWVVTNIKQMRSLFALLFNFIASYLSLLNSHVLTLGHKVANWGTVLWSWETFAVTEQRTVTCFTNWDNTTANLRWPFYDVSHHVKWGARTVNDPPLGKDAQCLPYLEQCYLESFG